MRFVSFVTDNGRPGFGALADSETGTERDGMVVELTDALPGASDLFGVLEQGRLDEAMHLAAHGEPTRSIDDLRLVPPVTRPGKVFCIGVNYGGRNAEYRDGSDGPNRPSVFIRYIDSFVGHGDDLVRPPESDQLDYEGEIVVVIGRTGRRISEDVAMAHIAGFTLGNEGTIRDWVRHAKFNVTQGKNWARSGSMGPWMTTADRIADFEALRLSTRVNGELRQDDTPATMAFPLPSLVSYLSTFGELRPGDLIFTGTPVGAGARFDPPRYLRPGDVVEVHVAELGTLRNGVRDEFDNDDR